VCHVVSVVLHVNPVMTDPGVFLCLVVPGSLNVIPEPRSTRGLVKEAARLMVFIVTACTRACLPCRFRRKARGGRARKIIPLLMRTPCHAITISTTSKSSIRSLTIVHMKYRAVSDILPAATSDRWAFINCHSTISIVQERSLTHTLNWVSSVE
jgi:hypothetical protein